MAEALQRNWPRQFKATNWTMVLGAARNSPEHLARLCETYWYPVYAFIRLKGRSSEDARDLTQQLFAELIGRNDFASLTPERGRFRSWLLRCAQNLLSNEHDRARAQKRWSGQPVLSLDWLDAEQRYRAEPVDGVTPESLYERRWALALLEQALDRVRAQQRGPHALAFFDSVRGLLLRLDRERPDFDKVAQAFGLAVGTVKVRVSRLQHVQLPPQIRAVIAETVGSSAELEHDIAAELRHLIRSLALSDGFPPC